MMKLTRMLTIGVAACLVGCASSGPSPSQDRDLAGEVRQAAQDQDSMIEVFPLTDPAAAELIRRARELEADSRYEEAEQHVAEALQVSPGDPEYLQYRAELNLRQNDYPAAIEFARQSYRLGPQLGQLCYRNWLTVNRAWEAIGNPEQASIALTDAEQCVIRERQEY